MKLSAPVLTILALQGVLGSSQSVEIPHPAERAVQARLGIRTTEIGRRASASVGVKWGTGAWKPCKLDGQIRAIQQGLKDVSTVRLQALPAETLALARKRRLTPLEAAKAALAIVEEGSRVTEAWASGGIPQPGVLEALSWAMHEALPASGGSREWVRARFLTEAYASAVSRKLAPVAKRLLASGTDDDLDVAVLYELVMPYGPSPLSREEIEAVLDRLRRASPTGVRYRAVSLTYHAMYILGKRREDLERAIRYRREWLRLAPPNASGRPRSLMLLEMDLKLLRELDRKTAPKGD